MYQLAHIKEQRRLIRVLSAFEENDAGLQILLFVGNGDYTDLLDEGSVSIGEDSPTILADLKLATRIRRDNENARVVLLADIDGIIVPMLSGSLSQPDPQEDFATHLLAASAGGLLNKVRMVPSDTTKHLTEYPFWTPERVIRDALTRASGVGGYDEGSVYIQRLGFPLLNYQGSDGFEDTAKAWDVLQKVSDQVGMLYRDTPDGGFEAMRSPETGEASPVAWTYETQTTEVLKWVPPTIASPDEQYSDVLVRKREDTGAYSVIGYAKVDYFRTRYQPHIDQTLVIDYTDPLDVDAASRARQIAIDHAGVLSRGVYKSEVVVSFNPLLQKGDVVHFMEDYVDERGRWRNQWRAVIKAMKHAFKEGVETDLTCDFYLIDEKLLPAPSTLGSRAGKISTGVVAPALGPAYPGPLRYPSPSRYPR